MKSKFAQIEASLQRLIEENLARIFSYATVERKLAERLADAMRAEAHQEGDEIVAPNHYTLTAHPALAHEFSANAEWLEKLEDLLYDAARQSGVSLTAPPTLRVISDASVPEGEFTVSASWAAQELGETSAMEQEALHRDENLPADAFLIVDGSQIYPLDEPVVNIGRSPENQLVIEDPRVSRLHAQMRVARGQFMLFDLDSTGGTKVNGQRIKQALLQPGDVISLAGVQLVYGQEAGRIKGGTEEYRGQDIEGESPAEA